MVYLLHAYFGRDGREEAEQLLKRNSGDVDSPRILGAFNEETTDWLSFFMFTYFTDRDGKYQLGTLKESGFDPLARTCDVHAQGGGAPHVRRHHRGAADGAADRASCCRSTAPTTSGSTAASRSSVHPEVPELPVLGVDRPVRLGDVVERRVLLRRRAQGPLDGDPAQGRPPPDRRPPWRCRSSRTGGSAAKHGADAHRAQPRPAQRVRRRLRQRRQALEPGAGGAGLEQRLVPAARGVQPQGRLVRRPPRQPGPAR